MLALLIGSITAAGLLMRGGWDVWAQSLLFIAAAAGTGAWLVVRVGLGYVPLPPRRLLAWTGVLAALAGASAWASPVPYYAVQAWRVLLVGLWIFCAVAVVSKDERAGIDQALRVAGWTLVLLAFYQRYHDGSLRPSSALLNQNIFAGAILLLLPLAVEQRDWFLFSGLFVCLCWSHSVGAWLGLACALVATRSSRESFRSYLGLSLAFICLVFVYGKLRAPDVLNRWHWWLAALRMSVARPVLGFGPGAYEHVAPAFSSPSVGLSALAAHQHALQIAAECGWLYLLAWGGGLVHFLRRGAPHKRFGAIALLAQSMWDYPLSVPGVFWIFCYFAASTTSQSSGGVNVRYERKIACAAALLALAAGGCWWAGRSWQADRLKALAVDAYQSSKTTATPAMLLERSVRLADDPEAERALAEMLLASEGAGPGAAREAAIHLERAARLNPYRASTWMALQRLYGALGEPEIARRLRRDGERYCPALRRGGTS